MKKILSATAIFEIICMGILGVCFYLCQSVAANSVLFVPQGSNARILAELNQHAPQFSALDRYLLALFGRPQSGWIAMSAPQMPRAQLFYELCHNKAAMVSVTLIPGETSEWFLRRIAAPKLGHNADKLFAEYLSQSGGLEGLLAPQTYSVPLGISERLFIKYLLDYSAKNFEKIAKKAFGEYELKSFYKYIVVASIIQKEAADEAEMPLVASVIYNRLRRGMKLQMDGSLNYGMHSHERITPERIRTDASEFNTYRNTGLPSVSICNVSGAAIRAAMFPAKSEYLYFMRDKTTGKHRFNSTLSAHEAEVSRQRALKK